ncbi:MAG: S1C family serine protease [Acidimicrobiales bacterium]
MDQRDDWVCKTWPHAGSLGQTAALVLAALLLVGTGAGLALVLTGPPVTAPSSSAGLSAISRSAGAMPTREIAHIVDPAVVDIDTVIESPSGPSDVAGTGMIVTRSGDIVTNNHVLEQATTIKVSIPGHRQPYLATFIGADPAEDIAVICIPGVHDFPTVRFANSSRIEVGEGVLAIGNALGLGGAPSVTSGTVSALGRSITATSETGADAEHLTGMIETDTPIAPGNSGGPLVDALGRVIGMDTAAASSEDLPASPIAFALPSNRVMAIARLIEASRRAHGVIIGRSAYLGIEGVTVSLLGQARHAAVNIVQVEPGTPASGAGMEPGDLIMSLDGHPTPSMARLSYLIGHYEPGTRVVVGFQAGGTYRSIRVRLVAGPAA